MIYANVNMVVRDYESICDKKIVLYRGDKNVQIRFVIKDNKFVVVENTYAQLLIKRPKATPIFSEISEIEDNTVVLTVTGEMIDELLELGTYQFQIRLYDNDLVSRATLPPCESCLFIEKPIIFEGNGETPSVVNIAQVNFSTATYSGVEEEIFDDEGEYCKTTWLDGDLITDSRLNKIEGAIYDINKQTRENIQLNKNDIQLNKENIQLNKNDIQSNKENIQLILDIIDEPPTYTKPTFNTTVSKTVLEHTITTSVSIQSSFTRNDAGNVISYSLSKGGTTLVQGSSIETYTDTLTLTHGQSVTYTATVTYGDGEIKNTLLGVPYPSTSIKSGSLSKSVTVTGYAISYYGVVTESVFESTDNLSRKLKTSRSDTLTFNLTNQRVLYMYPKSFGNLTSIKDANGFDYINSYTLSNLTVNDVEYNVYILTDPVTITGFKQIYN